MEMVVCMGGALVAIFLCCVGRCDRTLRGWREEERMSPRFSA